MVEQIGHLRGQLLRSEQDKELMRIKLEEEIAEREKAQKQVGYPPAVVHAKKTGWWFVNPESAALSVLLLCSQLLLPITYPVTPVGY